MKDKKIQWHPGFIAAMNLELRDSRDSLIFEKEHNLNTKPLEVDLLIIKKDASLRISNEIGAFFRGHNIIEYKAPGDSLGVDEFYKAMAYAGLYKAYGKTVDERKAHDITVTLIRDAVPKGLFGYLGSHGRPVSPRAGGIYHIGGNLLFPVQVIVTRELDGKAHAWLKALSKNLKKEDIRSLLGHVRELTGAFDQEMADSVLEVSFTANRQAIQEWMGDDTMYDVLMEFMEPRLVLRDEANRKEALMEGRREGWQEGRREGRREGHREGQQEGRQEGELKALYDLARDNVITLEAAAARKNLTVSEFLEKLKELHII